jgi:hypothetical protein
MNKRTTRSTRSTRSTTNRSDSNLAMPHTSPTRTSDTSSNNNSPAASPTQQQINMFFAEPEDEAVEDLALPALPGAALQVAALNTVWDHPLISVLEDITPSGHIKKSWKCLAPGCNKTWSGLNTTKALAHGSRDPAYCHGKHVKPCRGDATHEQIKLFADLLESKV